MGSNRIRKINTDMEFDRFVSRDAERLLAFNLTKKRIVDFCNQDFKDDPFDQAKNYSTWHRALDGNEVWEGIVHALEGLYSMQEKYPWLYLPDTPPEENLHIWMKGLASADWWMKVLRPEASPSAFRAWFSNRPMGKKKIEDVRVRVDEWWARLQEQVALSRRYTFAHQRREHMWRGERPSIESWDTWCKDRLEEAMSVDDVREAMVDEAMLLDRYHPSLLDLANPKALSPSSHSQDYLARERKSWGREFDERKELGFPFAVPRTPTEFEERKIVQGQWGDRRQERCSKDLNLPLYNMHYREEVTRWWDADTRKVKSESEIVEVSRDGVDWRAPNDQEKAGWDTGEYWIAYAFEHAGVFGPDLRNSYRRGRDELEEKRSATRQEWEYSAEGSELEARAKATVKRLEHEIATLHLRE